MKIKLPGKNQSTGGKWNYWKSTQAETVEFLPEKSSWFEGKWNKINSHLWYENMNGREKSWW